MTVPSSLLPYLSRKVLIATHAMPDGDAVGSVFGLSALVRRSGGQAICLFPEPVPDVFSYLKADHTIVNRVAREDTLDAVFILDCGSTAQVAGSMDLIPQDTIRLVIDHHRTREPFGDIEWVDATASATGLLIGELAVLAGLSLDAGMAKPLWCALLTDTGSFRYNSTDARTLRMGASLLEAGASPWEAAQSIYESHQLSRQLLLGRCLGTLELRFSGQVAKMHITREMAHSTGAPMDASSGFINYARGIAGVEICFLLRQEETSPDAWHVSFRSRGNFPVDNVAAAMGGGGHKNAAGCRLSGSLTEVTERIFTAIRDAGGPT